MRSIDHTYFTSNSQTARDFGRFVDQVLLETGADKVDVVSHSMGSLSTRECIKFGTCEGKVNDWVSLAGANHGTFVAALCLPFSTITCLEMLPGSRYLRTLNAPPEVTDGADSWTTLWSKGDGVIIPPQSTILDGAENIELSPEINHLSMLADPRVMHLTLDAVSN
jgi:triacylglycerol lipase